MPHKHFRDTLKRLICLALAWSPWAVSDDQLAGHPEVQGALAAIDAWVDGMRDYERVPGISIGVLAGQETLLAKGYGVANEARGTPADADTIFSICSISKLFTSISVMQLRDAGRLNLRDPVRDHLPWFNIQEQHPQAGPARILGLLTHSSGLPRESDFPYWVDISFPFPDRARLLERLASQSTLYPADTLFQYSNLGMTLAGEIVAATSGESYGDYVRTHVLEPLGLEQTRPEFPRSMHGRQMAIGYSGMDRRGVRRKVPPFDTRAIAPAAGFTSSVNDLVRFARWQFRLLDGETAGVLEANTLREMHRVHWVDDDWKVTWGLGFVASQAEGATVVGHGGACPGYITSLQMLPARQLAVIVLTNAGDGPASEIASSVLKTLAPAVKAARGADAEPAAAADPSPDLSVYAGNYGGSIWGGELAIREWAGKLAVVQIPADEIGKPTHLKQVDGDRFVRLTEQGDERESWVFQRDDDGGVTAVLRHSQIYQRL